MKQPAPANHGDVPGARTAGAPSASISTAAAVVCVGDLATYLCDAGDFMPTYPAVPPIDEDLLNAFYLHTDGGEQAPPPPSFSDSRGEGSSRRSEGKPMWASVAATLHATLRDRDAIVVVPIGSSPTFQSRLMVFLFSRWVGLRSAVLVSDVAADAIACGSVALSHPSSSISALGGAARAGQVQSREGGRFGSAAASLPAVVVHTGLAHITLATVIDGCAAKYTVSRVGSLHHLGKTVGVFRQDVGKPPPAVSASAASLLGMDLLHPAYRPELIAAFGYRSYTRALRAWERSKTHPQTAPPPSRHDAANENEAESARRGHDGGGGVPSTADGIQESATAERAGAQAWRSAFTKKQRDAPGSLEKLLARVVGGDALHPQHPLPAIVGGEALHVPFLAALLGQMVRRGGDAHITAAVEAEARAKARRLKREAKQRERLAREPGRQGQRVTGEDDKAGTRSRAGTAASGKRTREGSSAHRAEGNARRKKRPCAVPSSSTSLKSKRRSARDDEDSDEGNDSEPSGDSDGPSSSPSSSSTPSSGSGSDGESGSDSFSASFTSCSSSAQSLEGDTSGSESDAEGSEEDMKESGLREQMQPLPEAPWWLPLIGGSIISELTCSELAKLRITVEEVASSKGTIALWKAAL